MKTWKILLMIAMVFALNFATVSFSAVSPEEAAKLGTTLTRFGAEMAGNKEGTIPAYTGGLTKPPANYVAGSGRYIDPFAAEKPLFSINAQNMNQYADKLTDGTKALMKIFSTFRIDVYKTHRTVAYPEFVLKNIAKNAVMAKTTNGGLSVEDAHGGTPFPIPKNGYEVMWNHLLRFVGRATDTKYESYVADSSGRLILIQQTLAWEEFPYYDEDQTRADSHLYWKVRVFYNGPPRKAGERLILLDSVNMYEKGRIAYQYLPGQRRVKLAPEIGFDTPDSGTSGNDTYDESFLFNGSMERYNFKLIGKTEVYIPYNDYHAIYHTKRDEIFGPQHLKPDVIRWELHRMWVVEATLKPGKRHMYPKRRFYVDEDSWIVLSSENFDARSNLFKVGFAYLTTSYDIPACSARFSSNYNLISGAYSGNIWPGLEGYSRSAKVRPYSEWTAPALAGTGIR
jgi:hypothetical protein